MVRVYDISKELFASPVYPGDTAPRLTVVSSMEDGDPYHLSDLSMCLHNGTHIDAPRHFVQDGKTVDQIPINVFCGICEVLAFETPYITGEAIDWYLKPGTKRLLIKGGGKCRLSPSAAGEIAAAGVELVGIDHNEIGVDDFEQQVHFTLLSAGVVILENLDLSAVVPGTYYLCAAPLQIKGAEGAPCRAVLLR
mgnify:CR=1 FL=1